MSGVVVLADPQAVAESAVEETKRLARETIAARGRFVLALSGGSTPKLYHEQLAKTEGLEWSKIAIVFSDERAVPPDHKDSNFKAAKAALLDKVGARAFRVEADDGDARRAAAEYEKTLLENHLLPVDLLILGMGEDGHTASLFPGRTTTGGKYIASAEAPPSSPIKDRVTFTYESCARARALIALITGKNKAERLREVLQPGSELPFAAVLRSRTENTLLLVDRAAKETT